jgi:Raf kinase inhibitor-like YbhB/YbcL family protein
MAFTLTSQAFHEGSEIPRHYTCTGANVSPPFSWSGVPANVKSLVLIVDDPDAPDPAALRMTWVHWVLYNIPATASGVQEDHCRRASGRHT